MPIPAPAGYSGTPLPKKLGIKAGSWPKKASGVVTDLDESFVRDLGLAAGLVDYKVAAIDAVWSGLCFARRKAR